MNTITNAITKITRSGRTILRIVSAFVLMSMLAGFMVGTAIAESSWLPAAETDVAFVTVDDDFTPADPGYGVTLFSTIQTGVDAVDPGGTVQVEPGVYRERISITKSLSLIGAQDGVDPTQSGARTNPANEAIIRPDIFTPLDGNLITVQTDNVIIDGFYLEGNNPLLGPQGEQSNGVYLHIAGGIANGTYADHFATEVSGLRVRNNIIKSFNQYGVNLSSDGTGNTNVRSNNSIEQNWFDNFAGGITPIGSRHGIYLVNNQYSSVTNNKMTRTRVGLEISLFRTPPPGGPVAMSGNDFSTVQFGISINQIGDTTQPLVFNISGNTFRSDSGSVINCAIQINQIISDVQINLTSNTIIAGSNYGVYVTGWYSLKDLIVTGGSIGAALNSGFLLEFNDYDPPPALPINVVSRAVLDGVSINGGVYGVSVIDNGHSPRIVGDLKVVSSNDTVINGANTGILVNGPDAIAELTNSDSTGVSNGTIGIRITDQGEFSASGSKIADNETGILVENGGTVTSLTNNFIVDNSDFGIRIASGGSPGAINTLFNNSLQNLGEPGYLALQNDTSTTFVAGGNWWGGSSPAEVDPVISTDIDYSPWLDSGSDTNLTAPGFQGDFSYLHVDDIFSETSASAIQEGINLAALNGLVDVHSGNYPGSVNLNRNVQLDLFNNVRVEDDLTQSTGTIDAPAGNLYLEGDYLRSGGVFNDNDGTILMLGDQFQRIGGGGLLALNNWQLDNAGGVELAGDVQVEGNLAMSNTLLDIAAHRLLLSLATSIGGGALGENNMIVADGAGSVCKNFSAPILFNFPVGDASAPNHYSPAQVAFTGGTFSNGQVCVRVTRGKYPYNYAANYLRRYWTFTTSGISGSTATLTLVYSTDAEDIVGSKSVIKALEYQGANLTQVGQYIPVTPNQFGITTSALNGKIYTAGNTSSLVMISTSAVRLSGSRARVDWRVGAESDVVVYNVLRSETIDGVKVNVGSKAPTGSNSSYSLTDATLTPGNTYYYWIEANGPGEGDFLFGPILVSNFSTRLPFIFRP